MSYTLTDNERQELVRWYHRGVDQDNQRARPGRLEAFLRQCQRVRDGLERLGFLDEDRLAKFANAGRVGARVSAKVRQRRA